MASGKPTDPEPARSYESSATEFARSDRVEPAARDAAAAVDGPAAGSLRQAERAGKRRSAGEDPERSEKRSLWERISAALRRDWEQTINHLRPGSAPHLGQTAADTARQIAGTEPIPAGEKPVPPDVDADWEQAEPAVRFGHDAALRYPDIPPWSSELEARLRGEWMATKPRMPWSDASRLIRYGWDYRRWL